MKGSPLITASETDVQYIIVAWKLKVVKCKLNPAPRLVLEKRPSSIYTSIELDQNH